MSDDLYEIVYIDANSLYPSCMVLCEFGADYEEVTNTDEFEGVDARDMDIEECCLYECRRFRLDSRLNLGWFPIKCETGNDLLYPRECTR